MRDATADFYAPIPVGATEHHFYRGEISGPLTMTDRGPLPAIAGAGFSSLSDLIQEATANGKGQLDWFGKTSALAVATAAGDLSIVGASPSAMAAPAALAAGAVPTNATAGSLGQSDPTGGDTLHLATFQAAASTAPNTLLLYDKLWHGSIAMNSAASQTISGSPNRYTGTAAAGNFAAIVTRTALAATAHNNTITYVDEKGNAAEAATAQAGIASNTIGRMDHPLWFIPLNSGDLGVRNLTAYVSSAAVATGSLDIFIGRPIAFCPCPAPYLMGVLDGINSAFNLTQIMSGACLSLIELKGVASASTYTGSAMMVSG